LAPAGELVAGDLCLSVIIAAYNEAATLATLAQVSVEAGGRVIGQPE
jgi:hypothetical protein